MEGCARQFRCAGCGRLVTICSRCDHGHIYCGRRCSGQARRRTLHEAGRRYQDSRRGRINHAARQRRYRERTQKVTHHGSPPPPADDSLLAEPSERDESAGFHPFGRLHEGRGCHFCGRVVSAFVRLGFLGRSPPLSRARSVVG